MVPNSGDVTSSQTTMLVFPRFHICAESLWAIGMAPLIVQCTTAYMAVQGDTGHNAGQGPLPEAKELALNRVVSREDSFTQQIMR